MFAVQAVSTESQTGIEPVNTITQIKFVSLIKFI